VFLHRGRKVSFLKLEKVTIVWKNGRPVREQTKAGTSRKAEEERGKKKFPLMGNITLFLQAGYDRPCKFLKGTKFKVEKMVSKKEKK